MALRKIKNAFPILSVYLSIRVSTYGCLPNAEMIKFLLEGETNKAGPVTYSISKHCVPFTKCLLCARHYAE